MPTLPRVETMRRIGSLFTGYGGLDLAVEAVIPSRTVWTADIDRGASQILKYRFPHAPNLGDITAVDWGSVEPVDILTGGSPCQDLSTAGPRAGMTEGTRSNLWVIMREAIAHLRPQLVVWENVRGALSAPADSALVTGERLLDPRGTTTRGPFLYAIGRVVGDLASLGYDAGWVTLPASDVGAPHGRPRVFLIAWSAGKPPGFLKERCLEHPQGNWGNERSPRAADRQPERLTLLPTPVVVDIDAKKTVSDWLVKSNRLLNMGMPAATLTLGEAVTFKRSKTDLTNAARTLYDPLDAVARSITEGHPVIADAPEWSDDGGLFHSWEPMVDVEGHGVWGPYATAIERWEMILGRKAPDPTVATSVGDSVLNPALSEWMMGLPDGWVTSPDVWVDYPDHYGKPLKGAALESAVRRAQHKALGNGVCPQQAVAALQFLASHVP